MNLDLIKENYSLASTHKLTGLLNNLDGLEKDAVMLLLAELEKRKETDAVEKIHAYLKGDQLPCDYDFETIKSEIAERLRDGEVIESIKIDIINRIGASNYNLYLAEIITEEKDGVNEDEYIYAGASVLDMQERNLSEEDMLQFLKEKGVPKKTSEMMINKGYENKEILLSEISTKLKKRSRNDLIYGSVILGIGLLITLGSLTYGNGGYIITYGAIFLGIGKIIRGLNFKDINSNPEGERL